MGCGESARKAHLGRPDKAHGAGAGRAAGSTASGHSRWHLDTGAVAREGLHIGGDVGEGCWALVQETQRKAVGTGQRPLDQGGGCADGAGRQDWGYPGCSSSRVGPRVTSFSVLQGGGDVWHLRSRWGLGRIANGWGIQAGVLQMGVVGRGGCPEAHIRVPSGAAGRRAAPQLTHCSRCP